MWFKDARSAEGVGCGLKMRGLQGCWVWFKDARSARVCVRVLGVV